jgi:7-carboxy-7-deazaguanine synthase
MVNLVNELTHFANERDILITIETEGSILLPTDYPLDLISLSPKFSNSLPVLGTTTPLGNIVDQKMIDQHNKFRLKMDTIKQTLEYHLDYHYKPVWDGTEEGLAEIEAFRVALDIPKHKTFIMPAGDTRDELVKMYPLVFDMCAEKGYNMTGRDHIIAFDTRRMV